MPSSRREPCPRRSSSCSRAKRCRRSFDGLLLAGGPDVDPARYGEAPATPTLHVRAERDALDFAAFAQAQERGAPVFGICRGLQVVNVALGGTLWQDLPSQRGRGIAHDADAAGEVRDFRAHPVRPHMGALRRRSRRPSRRRST